MASTINGALKKRDLIAKAGKAMFLWVAAAAVAVSICLVTVQFLYQKVTYNNKVIDAKSKANTTLKKNVVAAEQLKKAVSRLEVNENLTATRKNAAGTNTRVVLDALPSKEDRAALATSLQQVILAGSGVSIKSIALFTNSNPITLETAGNERPEVGNILFSFEIQGSYDQIQRTIQDIERTILPIKLTSVSLQGNNQRMTAAMTAETYYQPVKTVQKKKETIRP